MVGDLGRGERNRFCYPARPRSWNAFSQEQAGAEPKRCAG